MYSSYLKHHSEVVTPLHPFRHPGEARFEVAGGVHIVSFPSQGEMDVTVLAARGVGCHAYLLSCTYLGITEMERELGRILKRYKYTQVIII